MHGQELELFERSLRHAAANDTGEALDTALEELGWADAFAWDPRAAVSILFEAQGGANATSSALERVVVAALGVDGDLSSGVILPALGRHDPPGEVAGKGLAVRGLGTAALRRHDRVVVVAATGAKYVSAIVDTADLTLRPVDGLDPALGIVEVTDDRVRATARSECSPAAWAAAVAAGQRAVAHELVGAARAMLELARAHALDRMQFGRPIASFQAVRHRLADSFVAIEAADAALGAAWDAESPLSAALAKAIAGRGARTVARHCQQVLAGIGFTAEHAFHRYLRRTIVLDQLLGGARSLTREVGEELLRTRRLPSLLRL